MSYEENASIGPRAELERKSSKAVFVEAFAKSGIVAIAAKAAGIHRATHYKWLKADPEYVAAIEAATEEAADIVEAEVRRRALRGQTRPVFYRGEQVGEVTEASDILLIFLMKALRPEKFRDRFDLRHEVTRQQLADEVRRDVEALEADGEAMELVHKLGDRLDVVQRKPTGGNGAKQ